MGRRTWTGRGAARERRRAAGGSATTTGRRSRAAQDARGSTACCQPRGLAADARLGEQAGVDVTTAGPVGDPGKDAHGRCHGLAHLLSEVSLGCGRHRRYQAPRAVRKSRGVRIPVAGWQVSKPGVAALMLRSGDAMRVHRRVREGCPGARRRRRPGDRGLKPSGGAPRSRIEARWQARRESEQGGIAGRPFPWPPGPAVR
jgi:hypothetical protein